MTRFVVVVAVITAPFVAHAQDASCDIDAFAPGPRANAADVLAQWNAEAQALFPVGVDVAFDLAAPETHATFDAATLASPSSLTGFDGCPCTIADAVVDGVDGTGTLIVDGASFTSTNASLVSAQLTAADAANGVVTLNTSSAVVDVSHATITGYASATLNGADVGTSFTLSSASSFAATSSIAHATVDAAAVDASARFAFAGDFATDASVAVDGATITPVRSVTGEHASFVVDGAGIVGTARITQVFDDAAPRMPADVEVQVLSPLIVVNPGESANVPAVVRNKSGHAVAILAEIDVDGCAHEAVTPVVDDFLPDVINLLVGAIQNAGWAAPFVALAVLPVLGVAIVAEAFVAVAGAFVDFFGDLFCGFFGGCSDPPPVVPPVPFPKWLEPGAVDYFEIALLPNLADGDYPVRVRFIGENYAEVHADFTLRVGRGAVPAEYACDVTTYGSDDGCDCGCGVVDTDCAGACDVDHCADGTHLDDDTNATCLADPPPSTEPPPSTQPPPSSEPPSGRRPSVDDEPEEVPFSCAAQPASAAFPLGVFAALLRRRSRGNGARGVA